MERLLVDLRTLDGLSFVVIVVLAFAVFVDEGKVFLKLHSLDPLLRFPKDYSLYLTVVIQVTFEKNGHRCHLIQHHSLILGS